MHFASLDKRSTYTSCG